MLLKEKIKSQYTKITNPILQNNKSTNYIEKTFSKRKSINKNLVSKNNPSNFPNKTNFNKTNGLFKTSYNTYFSNNKNEEKRKKSNKKIFTESIDNLKSHNNITGHHQKCLDDQVQKNSKKLFQTVYHKKSLSNLYRGDLEIKTKYESVQPDILHVFSTKKHFVKSFKFIKNFKINYHFLLGKYQSFKRNTVVK